MDTSRKKGVFAFLIGLGISILAFLVVTLYWTQYKTVDFCDDIYSYLIANSPNSYVQYMENVWFTNEYTNQILTTQRGAGFETTLINVSCDVHPPAYYMVFHLVSMIFGNSATKWIGLLINISVQLVSLVVLYILVYNISKNVKFSTLTAFAFIVLPFIISNTMLIRMYAMMSMWVALFMLAAYFIVTGRNSMKRHWYMYVIICLITVGGFMTQYYFSIFAVGFVASYAVYCLYKKQPKNILWILISMVSAVIISTFIWKHWTSQVFDSYRGNEVFSNLVTFEYVFEKIWGGLTTGFTFLFGNVLGYVYMGAMIGSVVYLASRKKSAVLAYIIMCLAASQFMTFLIYWITSKELFADRFFFASVQALWLGIACLAAYIIKHCNVKLGYTVMALMVLTIVYSISPFRTSYITQINHDKSEFGKKEQLEQYADIPWIYYGGEDWKMVGNLMDFLIPEEYILISNNSDYSQNEKLNAYDEFLIYVKDMYYDPREAIAEMEEVLGCEFEYEFLFLRGYSRVLLINKK